MKKLRYRLSRIVFCFVLASASIGGAYMRPEQIEELMYTMNRPLIAHTLPEEADEGDDLIRKLLDRNPDGR